jgi:hypothetical protein
MLLFGYGLNSLQLNQNAKLSGNWRIVLLPLGLQHWKWKSTIYYCVLSYVDYHVFLAGSLGGSNGGTRIPKSCPCSPTWAMGLILGYRDAESEKKASRTTKMRKTWKSRNVVHASKVSLSTFKEMTSGRSRMPFKCKSLYKDCPDLSQQSESAGKLA